MVVAAVPRLLYEFHRLLFEPGRKGAIDLRILHEGVNCWFAGEAVYGLSPAASYSYYPPASYALLWPFLGSLPVPFARWLWAATVLVALVWLVVLVVRESHADTHTERIFVGLLPLSVYASNVAIGNGQLIVHLLPPLVSGLILLKVNERSWSRDVLAALLVLFALMKPTIAAPFFWIVLFAFGTVRPAILVVIGYVTLTLFSATFQEVPLLPLLHDAVESCVAASTRTEIGGGYASIHRWLGIIGMEEWGAPLSLLIFGGLGTWIYFHRRADLWLLIGVTAIVARIWTHHRIYDDLLILLPMITLFGIARSGNATDRDRTLAGWLFGISLCGMLAPVSLIFFPAPWNLLFSLGQTTVWCAMLVFLLMYARRTDEQGS